MTILAVATLAKAVAAPENMLNNIQSMNIVHPRVYPVSLQQNTKLHIFLLR